MKEINLEPGRWILVSRDQMAGVPLDTFIFHNEETHKSEYIKPRYKVGEVVYIKETWCVGAYAHKKDAEIIYRVDGGVVTVPWNDWLEKHTKYGASSGNWDKWRSPLFLLAEFARDFIQITDVSAERLQEITEEDCYKEGLDLSIGMMLAEPHWVTKDILRLKYKDLWDSINPKYPWVNNPWNWRYEFKRIEVEER